MINISFLKSNQASRTNSVFMRSQKVQCVSLLVNILRCSEYFDKAVVNVYSKDDREHPLWLLCFLCADVVECDCFNVSSYK